MNILHYIDFTEPGGALNQVITLMNRCAENSELSLTLMTDNHPRVLQVVSNKLNSQIKTRVIQCTSPKDWSHIGKIRSILAEIKSDLVHVHLNHSGACRYLFYAAKGTPIVATEHDPFALSFPKKIIKKYTLRYTTKTIAVSEKNRQFMLNQYKLPLEKVVTIHNGIDVSAYAKKTDRQEINPSGNVPIIGSIMALHKRKGPDILIRSFKKVQSTYPNAKLFIAGDGPMKKELQTLIRELGLEQNVRLFGWVNDIPKFLSECNIFILTSRREAFGLAVLEAQAAQIPVIASNTGGISEIIDNGITGHLCKPGDYQAFAEAAIHLIQNPVECGTFVSKASEKLARSFSSGVVAKNTIALYKEILTTS